ncbi:glycosyltransferase, partial [Bacillus safensis]|uniref:glycosyltransferase family 2 protein n=1 Tax=Bacillus safensis TaxID=561879 RepID=UPI002DD435AA
HDGNNIRQHLKELVRNHGTCGLETKLQCVCGTKDQTYNQIHYTYLCLQSILEHTKDVSYEVIIADDVSTDATEHLAEFADNLVICRNQTNQ